jgi:hypothetical protein
MESDGTLDSLILRMILSEKSATFRDHALDSLILGAFYHTFLIVPVPE